MSDPDDPPFRRVVRRERPLDRRSLSWSSLHPKTLWSLLRVYFGLGRAAPMEPIDTPAALAAFLQTRASFIAQTSLYGYLRTRAGMRYPELFDDDAFVAGINIAKWHVWLDCLSDIAVYAGSRMAQEAPRDTLRIAAMMASLVERILEETGVPDEAGDEFVAHAARVRDRVARIDWLAVGDQEAAFSESPAGLVRWAPVKDDLKELDEEIVLNSVRFRWQEVRRDFLRYLETPAILAASAD